MSELKIECIGVDPTVVDWIYINGEKYKLVTTSGWIEYSKRVEALEKEISELKARQNYIYIQQPYYAYPSPTYPYNPVVTWYTTSETDAKETA
jgi:hypothetical protein